ncbi:Brp/Blh family beta-carotene 15,15'-dioxygenase [Natrialbaceae archaeon A-arb3/5]
MTASSGDEEDIRIRHDARNRAAAISRYWGFAAIAVGLLVGIVLDTPPISIQLVPLVVSVIALGLPHGAVDHLVLPRVRNDPVTYRSLAFVGSLYLSLSGLYLLAWFVTPVAAFVFFLALTVVHWGQGDVYVLRELVRADHLDSRLNRVGTALVRGGIPMVVPLLTFPDQYELVATAVVGLFNPTATSMLGAAFEPSIRPWISVAFGTLVTVVLAVGFVTADSNDAWLLDAAETGGLLALFAFVPPILAIGLYFPFWHSLRHVLRTLLVDEPSVSALGTGHERRAFRRFARDAAPLTTGALVVLVALATVIPRTPTSFELLDFLALYLVCLAVFTAPHTVIVSLLDREQGIWS